MGKTYFVRSEQRWWARACQSRRKKCLPGMGKAKPSTAFHSSVCVSLSCWGNLGSEFFLSLPLFQAGEETTWKARDTREMLSLASVTQGQHWTGTVEAVRSRHSQLSFEDEEQEQRDGVVQSRNYVWQAGCRDTTNLGLLSSVTWERVLDKLCWAKCTQYKYISTFQP